jgi:hypothetical protein
MDGMKGERCVKSWFLGGSSRDGDIGCSFLVENVLLDLLLYCFTVIIEF